MSDDCEQSCQASCTASCTESCTSYCDKNCTASCTDSCTESCTKSCTSGCQMECLLRCIASCTTSCTTGCTSMCTACENICMTGDIKTASQITPGPTLAEDTLWKELMDHKINAILSESNRIVRGEFQEGKVRVESNVVILPPNTSVLVKMDDGSIVQSKSVSSLIMKLLSPVEVFLEVIDADGKLKFIGSRLVMAEGDYKKGTGVTIAKGSDATILFNEVVYRGKTSEEVLIRINKLGIRPTSIGITKITN